MTKEREPLTYERALCTIAGQIGWDRVAAVLGIAERTARKYGEPDIERELSLLDCERLDRAFVERGGGYAPFHRTLTLRIGLPDESGDCIVMAAAHVAKETGEATAAIMNVAARPGCRTTRRTARRETQQAIEALGSAMAALGEGGE